MSHVEEYKVAIVGSGSVGKSSITLQYVKHQFQTDYDPTIEDNHVAKKVIDGLSCSIEIVDTAGQDEYKTLRSTYMRYCRGFVLVYDITNIDSLYNLIEFIEEIQMVKDLIDFPCVLIGNKVDLEQQYRKVKKDDIHSFTKKYLSSDVPVLEVSAKKRQGIDELFDEMVRQLRKFDSRKVRKPTIQRVVAPQHEDNPTTSSTTSASSPLQTNSSSSPPAKQIKIKKPKKGIRKLFSSISETEDDFATVPNNNQ